MPEAWAAFIFSSQPSPGMNCWSTSTVLLSALNAAACCSHQARFQSSKILFHRTTFVFGAADSAPAQRTIAALSAMSLFMFSPSLR